MTWILIMWLSLHDSRTLEAAAVRGGMPSQAVCQLVGEQAMKDHPADVAGYTCSLGHLPVKK